MRTFIYFLYIFVSVRRPGKKVASPSTDKSRRIMLLAVLFQVSWPKRLTKQEIIDQLPMLYGDNPNRALYRDIETLTDTLVDDLPEPDAEHLADWCNAQQQRKRLAITYERRTFTFGLAQSIFSIDISEDEARAFVCCHCHRSSTIASMATPFCSWTRLLRRVHTSRLPTHLSRKVGTRNPCCTSIQNPTN